MNTLTNANNATSGDNSSDSASNKNTEKKLELIEKKLKSCSDRIESLKKKAQREWSNQMNNHLMSFYPDADKSKYELNKNKKSLESQSEIEKEIVTLTKKLHTYEKRRQECLYEQSKENNTNLQLPEETDLNLDSNVNVNNPSETNNKSGSNSNLNSLNGVNTSTTPVTTNISSNSFQFNNITPNQNVSSLPVKSSFVPAHRTQSFIINQQQKINEDIKQPTTNDDKVFYLNQDNSNYSNEINGETFSNEEQLNKIVYGAHKKIEQIAQIQTDSMSFIMEQHEKLQSYLDDLQKKFDEHTKMVKEMQQVAVTNTTQLERIQSCLFLVSQLEKKFDDLKSTSSQSFHSLQYNFTHLQRDVKDIKEDVSFMKNKVEMVEKNQKNYTESNPTNYYQLFYKLLDIILTLATIFLLAITNLFASIKFIFLLYPRTIVILLFLYFLFFYLVDHNKLLLLFTDSNMLNHEFDHQNHHSQFLNLDDNDSVQKSNLTYFGKLFRSIYKLIFNLKQSSTTTS